MISLQGVRELYDYNYWARDQQLAACAGLSEEQLTKSLGSSFGTLRETLKHLVYAEWIWLERFLGRSPRGAPWSKETQALDQIRTRWQTVETEMRGYLRDLKPERLVQPFTYQNTKGETWSYPLWQCLVHLANHGTYHRGQVTMALRQLGAIPPEIDLLVYYDKKK